ncbi:uncharacterized protein LOC107849333 [Capsicum annuum]|uniref:uncharacterized protein LOC107849333 n=1 Tax=Capsicum annuum TaxID=4072 RepID=UPI0007BFA7F5|nr:uncharacterized protein LOC107849333 [Capsicum annuum]
MRSGLQTKEMVNEQENQMITDDSLQENTEVEDKEKEKDASKDIRVEKKTIPLPFPHKIMPKYVKYLKDIFSNKNWLVEYDAVALTQECTSKIQNKLPTKLKDPRSFTLQITLGHTIYACGLCDLGDSINLMPTS